MYFGKCFAQGHNKRTSRFYFHIVHLILNSEHQAEKIFCVQPMDNKISFIIIGATVHINFLKYFGKTR